ncbi:DUF2889 family protein [Sinobacterium caligoides]|uniref:DUF2889 family protein n=1 Tax=Sinobacterium caligoides TaxID=933926 RepID=A0A3N2DGY0_9GAMM|nr:DUF2889 domain-containing protein [Sinobacterium caligoides]ROR99053.1 DUF2889 family protein [Sinobacterium caligoides]
MSSMTEQFTAPLNEAYGEGVYRRRIRLIANEGTVVAELEDIAHGFRVRLEHDGERVTRLLPEVIRAPFSTCTGAVEPLQSLLGVSIGSRAVEVVKQSDIASQCTHLFDLATLAIVHCRRGGERLWDLTVADQPQPGEPVLATAHLDGELLLSWRVADWTVKAPALLNGNTLFKGFSAWADEAYSGDAAEAAFALQKAYFVAQARRFEVDNMAGRAAIEDGAMQGVCYTYSQPVIEQAVRLPGGTRDFTDNPEQLLSFL